MRATLDAVLTAAYGRLANFPPERHLWPAAGRAKKKATK